MNPLHLVLPFKEGNRYVLEFSLSEDANDFVEIPVVEVAISLKKRVANTNSTKVFNFIIEKIRDYMAAREVILYYYCDSSDIYYRNSAKRRFTSPQHFRSVFFSALFKKAHTNLLIEEQKIDDEIHGNHYLAFIYDERHKEYVKRLVKELEDYQNK